MFQETLNEKEHDDKLVKQQKDSVTVFICTGASF